jgi:hypothetical protein
LPLGRSDVHPSFGLVVATHLGCFVALSARPRWPLVLLALGGYLVRIWAITAGDHRYLVHAEVEPPAGVRTAARATDAALVTRSPR